VLVTTLLVMTLLTVLLTAAFVMISAESRTTGSAYESSRSLNLAQAGLQSYFASSHNLTSGKDSTDYTFPGGYARVVARRLRDSTATIGPLWIVYSAGVDTTRSLTTAGGAQRVVAQLAYLSRGTLPTRAAMVAANGVQMQGSGARSPIDGTNFNASVTGCTQVGTAGDTTGLFIYYGGLNPNANNPPKGKPEIDSVATISAVIDSTHIDWVKLVNGEFTPDFYNQLPAGPYPNTNYQTYYYPSADVTIPANWYRGLLVVSGDVTLASSAHWDGVIVAGGKLNIPSGGSPSYTIHGTIITGLNEALGQSVNRNQLQRAGSGLIEWDWCYARSAINSLGFLTPIRGTYTDTWDTY
jgi:Tfp pilus assembly protein PilX